MIFLTAHNDVMSVSSPSHLKSRSTMRYLMRVCEISREALPLMIMRAGSSLLFRTLFVFSNICLLTRTDIVKRWLVPALSLCDERNIGSTRVFEATCRSLSLFSVRILSPKRQSDLPRWTIDFTSPLRALNRIRMNREQNVVFGGNEIVQSIIQK